MTNLLQMSVFTSFMLAQFPAIAATDYEIEAASNDGSAPGDRQGVDGASPLR